MICNVNYVKKIAMPLPESTETRRNLRHSERSERGGKVPEGLRVIQVGIRSRSLSEGTSAGSSEANEEEKFLSGRRMTIVVRIFAQWQAYYRQQDCQNHTA